MAVVYNMGSPDIKTICWGPNIVKTYQTNIRHIMEYDTVRISNKQLIVRTVFHKQTKTLRKTNIVFSQSGNYSTALHHFF